MSWWDQGYWIIQTARRVPISNPTQNGADTAARFLTSTREDEALAQLSRELQKQTGVSTVVVHPVTYALAVSKGFVSIVDGPYVAKPVITTGAGDHFNAGFCLGKLLGFDNECSTLLGVTTSGYYVRYGLSPGIPEIVTMLRDWPEAG